MGLIPRETQTNINQALKCLYSIDKSLGRLGRIAEALEKQNELLKGDACIKVDPGEEEQ